MARQAVGGFGGERRLTQRERRRERTYIARTAVDVAAAEGVDALVAGDRMQADLAEIPAHAQAAAELVELLFVDAVDRHLVATEVVAQFIGAGLDDARTEQARGAFELARVHIRQRFEGVARLEQELQAHCGFFVAFEVVARAVVDVVDPVGAALAHDRQACGGVLADRPGDRALQVDLPAVADADARIAAEFFLRARRLELDHAGRRIAAEQGALRAACHFDLVEVEQREPLEDRVFLDHPVVHQRDRLRGVEVEIGIAQATDVEARERTAERGLDVQARQAAREQADVVAAGGQGLDLLAVQRGDRHRHVLDVLGPALRGHVDGVQFGGVGRRGLLGHGRQGQQHGGSEAAQAQCATGRTVRGGHAESSVGVNGGGSVGRMCRSCRDGGPNEARIVNKS